MNNKNTAINFLNKRLEETQNEISFLQETILYKENENEKENIINMEESFLFSNFDAEYEVDEMNERDVEEIREKQHSILDLLKEKLFEKEEYISE